MTDRSSRESKWQGELKEVRDAWFSLGRKNRIDFADELGSDVGGNKKDRGVEREYWERWLELEDIGGGNVELQG